MFLGIPSILLLVFSVILLVKNKNGSKILITIKCFLIIAFILLGYNLYKPVDEYGWLQPRIHSETLKITDDNKYEYKIELVNMFQRNSLARLYMKNIQTEEAIYISLDINTRNIGGFSMGQDNNWGHLTNTQVDEQYILYTTEEFPFPINRYLVNVKKNQSEKIDSNALVNLLMLEPADTAS